MIKPKNQSWILGSFASLKKEMSIFWQKMSTWWSFDFKPINVSQLLQLWLPIVSFVLCYCIKFSLFEMCCFYIFGRTSCAGTASVSASHMMTPLLYISLRKCIKQDIHLHISPSAIICFILVSFGFVIMLECNDSSWLRLTQKIS